MFDLCWLTHLAVDIDQKPQSTQPVVKGDDNHVVVRSEPLPVVLWPVRPSLPKRPSVEPDHHRSQGFGFLIVVVVAGVVVVDVDVAVAIPLSVFRVVLLGVDVPGGNEHVQVEAVLGHLGRGTKVRQRVVVLPAIWRVGCCEVWLGGRLGGFLWG